LVTEKPTEALAPLNVPAGNLACTMTLVPGSRSFGPNATAHLDARWSV
jgi:hypothetical protein